MEGGKKRGPAPRPAEDLRTVPVGCKLTVREAVELDRRRAKISRGEYLRRAALGQAPRTIPEINRAAWAELGRLAGGLASVARAVREGRAVGVDRAEIEALGRAVAALRRELVGL